MLLNRSCLFTQFCTKYCISVILAQWRLVPPENTVLKLCAKICNLCANHEFCAIKDVWTENLVIVAFLLATPGRLPPVVAPHRCPFGCTTKGCTTKGCTTKGCTMGCTTKGCTTGCTTKGCTTGCTTWVYHEGGVPWRGVPKRGVPWRGVPRGGCTTTEGQTTEGIPHKQKQQKKYHTRPIDPRKINYNYKEKKKIQIW